MGQECDNWPLLQNAMASQTYPGCYTGTVKIRLLQGGVPAGKGLFNVHAAEAHVVAKHNACLTMSDPTHVA